MIFVICCGDRNWKDFKLPKKILKDLLQHDPFITVVHGNCSGADEICDCVAHELGMTVKPEPANWNDYGLAAGPIRNQSMLNKYKIDVVIAFHNDIEHSKGTKDMVERAKKAKIPIILVSEKNVQNIVDTQTKL